jgi:hypothetical protein
MHCCSSANVTEPRKPHTCNNIKQAICKVAENTLGYYVKKVRNGWYGKECKEVLEVQNCARLNK